MLASQYHNRPYGYEWPKVDQFDSGVKVDRPKLFLTYPSFEHDTN
jgi:hypothetical protein